MISGSILLLSCEEFNPHPCGPFNNKYISTGMEINTLRIIFYDSLPIRFEFDHVGISDTVPYGRLALRLMPVKQFYRTSALPCGHTFSIFNQAYACSPPIPGSDEKIDSIMITSTSDFDQSHKSGKDLADLFDVAAVDRATGSNYYRMSLTDYLELHPTTKDELIFFLREPPEKTGDFVFKIRYKRTLGPDQREFFVESTNVVIPRE